MRQATRWVAWVSVVWLVVVVLFGAWVRISHSGAGCGDDWPVCHGAIFPENPAAETLVEYTHRLTSGLAGVLVLAVLVLAFRGFGARARVTRWAGVTLVLLIVEAAVGAGLVIFGLVVADDSIARGLVAGVHVVNTLLLVGAATVTAWLAGERADIEAREAPPAGTAGKVALLLFLVMAATGAMAGLSHTLFPPEGSGLVSPMAAERMAASETRWFYEILGKLHLLTAVVLGLVVLGIEQRLLTAHGSGSAPDRAPGVRRWLRAAQLAAVATMVVGVLSIGLGTSGWVQLTHLLFAEVAWMGLAVAVAVPRPAPAAPAA